MSRTRQGRCVTLILFAGLHNADQLLTRLGISGKHGRSADFAVIFGMSTVLLLFAAAPVLGTVGGAAGTRRGRALSVRFATRCSRSSARRAVGRWLLFAGALPAALLKTFSARQYGFDDRSDEQGASFAAVHPATSPQPAQPLERR